MANNYDSFRWKFFIVLLFGATGAGIGYLLSKFFQTAMLPAKIAIGMAVIPIIYFRLRKGSRSGICFVCRRFVQTEMEREKSSHEDPLFAGAWVRSGKICLNCGRVACHSCSDVPCRCGCERRKDVGVAVSI